MVHGWDIPYLVKSAMPSVFCLFFLDGFQQATKLEDKLIFQAENDGMVVGKKMNTVKRKENISMGEALNILLLV